MPASPAIPTAAPVMPPPPAASINPATGAISKTLLTTNEGRVASIVARQQPTTAAAVARSYTRVSGNQLKSLTKGKKIYGVGANNIFSKDGRLFVEDLKMNKMIRLQEHEEGFYRLGLVPISGLSTGGLVYAQEGTLVPSPRPAINKNKGDDKPTKQMVPDEKQNSSIYDMLSDAGGKLAAGTIGVAEAILPTIGGAAGAIALGTLGTLGGGPAAPVTGPAGVITGGYYGSKGGDNWNNFIGSSLEGTRLKKAWDDAKKKEPEIYNYTNATAEIGGSVLTGGMRATAGIRQAVLGRGKDGFKFTGSLEDLFLKKWSRTLGGHQGSRTVEQLSKYSGNFRNPSVPTRIGRIGVTTGTEVAEMNDDTLPEYAGKMWNSAKDYLSGSSQKKKTGQDSPAVSDYMKNLQTQAKAEGFAKGGVVYAQEGKIISAYNSIQDKDIENNERVFSSYSDKFGSSSSPISDGAIVSDKVGIPQPKISPNSTRINGTIKNISAKMAQGKEVQDIKGIELSENQVAKINNLYTEAKDQTVPALDKILDKQSISKASESISNTVNSISNVIKGINQQTELVGSIGTSGNKELFAQMSPKTISGSVNNSGPQYKADGGIVYASNGTFVAARSVGTDTVPAMLTPGEFVVNRQASQQHMPILQAINSGAYNQGGVVKYLAEGGIIAPQYYAGGALAGLAGGVMSAFNGMDMSAVMSLANSLAQLKDTFGSLENVKDLGETLKGSVETMRSVVGSFGEHITNFPAELAVSTMQNITKTTHHTGLGDIGQQLLAQAAANSQVIANNSSSSVVYNLHKNTEASVTAGNPDAIMGHVGGGGIV